VGAVNVDEHNSLGGQYGVTGFPTIKIFGANKNKPDDYNGPRTAQGLVDAGFDALRSKVSGQMSGKKSGGSSSDGKQVSCFGKFVLHLLHSDYHSSCIPKSGHITWKFKVTAFLRHDV
jgi:protein disulfide-isomerase A6